MAAFSGLTEKLQETFRKLRNKGKVSEQDVVQAMREVRLALLEADVHYRVVKDMVERIRQRAVGQEVLKSLTPGQLVVKIVHEEMTELMGPAGTKLAVASKPPTVVLLLGLQGAGKTTTVAKLGRLLRRDGRKPLLVAGDIYRPAAVNQLKILGEKAEIPVFSGQPGERPPEIAFHGWEHARLNGFDYVLIDTAGRLHIDQDLMAELEAVQERVEPHEKLLALDAMTGQDAVNVAETFHQRLKLDGVILTKLDGDTRGGAALSVKAVTGCPIKFVGMGEKLDALEAFHPDRMASRILGMGDIVTLVERAQASMDVERARKLEAKIRQNEFSLEDFLEQLQGMKSMGSLEDIMGMIPGLAGSKRLKGMAMDEKELTYLEAIIRSMTPEERQRPDIINGSRKRRVARGSGTSVQQVNRLLKQFADARRIMQQLGDAPHLKGAKSLKKARGLGLPFIK